MAIVRKEWEDIYDEIKNMPDVPTNEQAKEEWNGKEMQLKARLAEIKDTTSPEYKAIIAERKEAKKEFESQQISYYSVQKYLEANGTSLDMVKKNFKQIDKTRENRDIYQSLLDELLEAKEFNSQREAKREQIQAQIKRLDEELDDLKQQEQDALNAIENFAKTPEQKQAAQSWLEEVRGKIKINQNEFPERHKELKEELSKPLIEVPENDVEELQEKIDRCNKTCELLLQGKSVREISIELGKKQSESKLNQEEQKADNAAPGFKPASDLEEKETTEQETGFRRAGDLDKEEKPEKEVKTPEFRPASDLEEKETTEQETGFRRAGDLDKEVKSQKEVKTPGFKPASDLEVKATAVKATAFTRAGNLGEEDKLEKTTPEFEPASDLEAKEKTEEHPKVKSLNKIIIRIGENGKSITTIEREGETPDVGEGLELWALDSKITECAKIAPEADKWVGREIWRNNTAGLLSKEEMKEQYSIYLDIMRGKNIEENKKKLKIDLKYDLTGLRGLNRNIKKEIKANAKKAKRIGIAEVETRYSKFVNVVWNLASDAVAKVKGVFTKALPEPENTTRTNTSEEASYEDKVLADLDNKGAFDHSYEYKPTEKTTTKVSKRSMSESSKKSKTPKEFRNEMSYGDKLIENYDSRGAFNHSYKSKSEQENEEIVK